MIVHAIHNRPKENNCYDDFVRWSWKQGYPLRAYHWTVFDLNLVDPVEDKVAVWMQDPVPHNRMRVIPPTALNRFLNNSDRRYAYPIWRANGIYSPPPPEPFDYLKIRKEGKYPYLIKDLTKQMGKGFVVHNQERLDWLATKSKKFNEYNYHTLRFINTSHSDGYFRLHRYFVCGDRAIPCRFAKTPQWNCKGSHMYEAKHWGETEKQSFVLEYEAFWNSTPPDAVVKAVKLLDIDFALVDSSITENGVQVFWEVNPYINMFPNSSPGIHERWFTFYASYLYNIPFEDEPINLEEFIKQAVEFKGYKEHWSKRVGNKPQHV